MPAAVSHPERRRSGICTNNSGHGNYIQIRGSSGWIASQQHALAPVTDTSVQPSVNPLTL